MEYYAKSVGKCLSKDRVDRIVENTISLINEYDENGYYELICKLKTYLKNIDIKLSDKEQKTLAAHTQEILACAEKFFDIYGTYFTDKEKYLITKACEWHDVGKVNLVFQSIVNPNIHLASDVAQIPHGFLSALSVSKKKICAEMMGNNLELLKDDFRILVSAIYYHHDRDDVYTNNYIEKYAEKWYKSKVSEYLSDEEFKFMRTNRNKLLFSDAPDVRRSSLEIPEDIWCEYMLVKGMLNKFDWTVSSGYEEAELGVDICEKKLCKNIETKMQGSLRPAQEYMKANSDKNVVMIAPTGSGKTEAALLWLNGDKGFYTLPLRVSANAIYERIKYKYEFENTAILHSNSLSYYSSSNSDTIGDQQKRYERAKLLAYPLTVCTVDQLLKFVYKFPGTEVFAATLKYSKLIIDEIQAYSPKIVAALIYGLKEINMMGGKFAIITATFPPVMSHFMKEHGLLEDRDYVYQDWNIIVDQEINFDKRVIHPPDNMINSLISFVNSLIYSKVLSEIYKTQLNPTISYLHEPGVRRFSLCLDISEVFKPLIGDRLIFSLLNRRQITEDSFTKELNFLHLKKESSRLIAQELEKSLKKTIMHKELGRQVSYQYLMRLEAYKLIKHLIGEKQYEGFKIWW